MMTFLPIFLGITSTMLEILWPVRGSRLWSELWGKVKVGQIILGQPEGAVQNIGN